MSTKALNGRHAVTHYRVLERLGNYTYIECELETGRTHQIRVHMASIGHPILGDDVYGPAKCPFHWRGRRCMQRSWGSRILLPESIWNLMLRSRSTL